MLFSGVFGVSLFGDILTIYIKWLDVQYGVSCNTAGLLNHVVRVCVCVCVCVCYSPGFFGGRFKSLVGPLFTAVSVLPFLL